MAGRDFLEVSGFLTFIPCSLSTAPRSNWSMKPILQVQARFNHIQGSTIARKRCLHMAISDRYSSCADLLCTSHAYEVRTMLASLEFTLGWGEMIRRVVGCDRDSRSAGTGWYAWRKRLTSRFCRAGCLASSFQSMEPGIPSATFSGTWMCRLCKHFICITDSAKLHSTSHSWVLKWMCSLMWWLCKARERGICFLGMVILGPSRAHW